MKKYLFQLLALTIIITSLLLTGCGESSENEANTTKTVTTKESQEPSINEKYGIPKEQWNSVRITTISFDTNEKNTLANVFKLMDAYSSGFQSFTKENKRVSKDELQGTCFANIAIDTYIRWSYKILFESEKLTVIFYNPESSDFKNEDTPTYVPIKSEHKSDLTEQYDEKIKPIIKFIEGYNPKIEKNENQ